jgi:hypothetical protein
LFVNAVILIMGFSPHISLADSVRPLSASSKKLFGTCSLDGKVTQLTAIGLFDNQRSINNYQFTFVE